MGHDHRAAPAAINYEYDDTTSVSVTTGHAADTVNVLATGVTTNLIGNGGRDTVNVGNAGSVQGILGTLSIENPPSFNTINVNDSADTTARTVTLSTFVNPNDSQHNSDPWGTITGLAPAAINYEYDDTTSVSVTTGHAADTVNVLATGVTTNLIGNGGRDTVNVGNAGSVQGILGTLSIENPPSFNTINVNDSADTTARTVTLSTFVNPNDSQHNSDPWGTITGLAPAAINYEYDDTTSVSVTTGHAADTVNVLATGVTTNLIGNGGRDTVNVGNAGSVQGILAAVNIENPPRFDTINVNDSADTTARTVTLSTFVNPNDSQHNSDPWGTITGLAPAAINYEYDDTTSVSVTTGHAADTVNVLATGVTTNLIGNGGRDTVNVGNAGSVQGILGTLSIENPPSFNTINVNDSADTTARTVTLSTFVNPNDSQHNSDPWGTITGLRPRRSTMSTTTPPAYPSPRATPPTR